MFFRRVVTGTAIVAFGLALAVLPVVPGVAGVASAHPSFCSLNKHATKIQSKTETAIVKAIESGNWPTAQKALLASFNQDSGAVKAAIAALSGAPSKVRSAGSTMISFANSEVKIVKTSTSAAQFESAEESAAESPKIEAAEKVLTAYFDNQCGIKPTPTPTS